MPERLDDPRRPPAAVTAPSRVVGLGASAGGIKALKAFFSSAPHESGIAYVVVVHMSPVHDSNLAEVLQSDTRLPVTAVRQRIKVEANHVYVVSPDAVLRMDDGHLLVTPVDTLEARRSPIDILFRTLGDAHGERAVAVVLSGSGADGSSGIKRVNEQGGLVMAQDPGEAEYPDMPLNAIRTGVVDFVLPIAAMADRILEYDGRLFESIAPLHTAPSEPDEDAGAELYRRVMTLLRVRTGHDFSNYKPATVLRRISRRMRLHQLTDLADYASRLRTDAVEPQALMKELLISVTNFFRDPAAFATLEARALPQIFTNKSGDDQVRAWVVGCATGEEAYSMAMLCVEAEERSAEHPAIHVFATDLDEQAIAIAREGHYNEADVADVPAHRLERFFQRTGQGYRVRRELRERVLFAHHNAIKDPPFSHLDLLSCRNMLIYLNRTAQERLLDTFHFALRPGGYLLLGTSESADSAGDLFATVDQSAHIYESRVVSSRQAPATAAPVTLPSRTTSVAALESRVKHIFPADLHLRLLEQYAAPSLVVTDEGSIVHMSEGAGRFLELRGGELSRDLFKLIRPELRIDLRAALRRALQERTSVEIAPIALHEAGAVRVLVRPVLDARDSARGYLLIVFEPAVGAGALPVVQPAGTRPAALALEEELTRLKDQLRTTVEQYETQVEEAHAANEELQALNEELRSSSEELETSKEELQSVNEELTTVNQELKIKIEELRLTNDDFLNFINATDVGTIFVDRGLRVKLSTARAREVFNLLPSDSGRQLTDITSRLDYAGLTDDLQQVIETLQPLEREVPASNGGLFLLRMTPYRTSEHRIEGAVLTFLDITSRAVGERRIRAGEERLRLLIESAVDYAIFTMNQQGIIDFWNSGAERVFGYPAADMIGADAALLFTPEDRAAGVPADELRRAAADGRVSDERFQIRKDGSRFYCSGVTTQIGAGLGFAKIARDLSTQRGAESALQEARDTLERRVLERTLELQGEVAHRDAAQADVVRLLRKLVTAQETERRRIARDLHDHLGQELTALRLTLDACRSQVAPAAATEIERALLLTRQIDEAVDFLAWELRPAVLDDLGLVAALPRFLEQWSEHSGVLAEFRGSGLAAGQLSGDAEVALYRITQEALNNVAKHAHASRVDVILERHDDAVVLIIEDDGIGFDSSNLDIASRGIGLAGMRERAALIGAQLDVESAVGKGSSVFVRCVIDVSGGDVAGAL